MTLFTHCLRKNVYVVFSTKYDFFGSQLFLSLTCTLSIYSSKAEEHKPKNFITGKCCYTIYLYTTIKLETETDRCSIRITADKKA